MSYNIKADLYSTDWYELNGGEPNKGGFQKIPLSLDPKYYMEG